MRILVGYAVPLLTFLVVAGLALSGINQLVGINEQKTQSLFIAERAAGLALAYGSSVAEFRGYLITGDPLAEKRYEDANVAFDTHVAALSPMLRVDANKAALGSIVEKYAELIIFQAPLIERVRAGDREGAQQGLSEGAGPGIIRDTQSRIDDLLAGIDARARAEDAEQKAQMFQLNAVLLTGTSIAVLVGIGAGLFLASRIGSTAETINDSIATLASSSTELAANVEQQDRTANAQAASVNETTATMEELDAASRQMAAQAGAASEAAGRALSLARDGMNIAGETIEGMNATRQKAEVFTQAILELSEQVNQIGEVTRIVGEIGGEVNMLALNASVEASRAGEHGRGFAVVAGEIRKLAEQSRREADRIRALVADIQKATNTTVMATEQATKTIAESLVLGNRTVDTFQSVEEAGTSAAERAAEIALTAKQQAEAVQQVLQAMNEITVGARQTADGINQTRELIRDQNAVVERLGAFT